VVGGASHRVTVTGMLRFWVPRKSNNPHPPCRVIGKPSFADHFSSLDTVNDRLESKYVKWNVIRQLFHKIFLSC